MEKVDVSFYGYADIGDRVWELKEVRDFMTQVDEKFPYWLFFMNKFCEGLQYIYLCKRPPVLTREQRIEIFPRTLARLMNSRWLPAMREMAMPPCGPVRICQRCIADSGATAGILPRRRRTREKKTCVRHR